MQITIDIPDKLGKKFNKKYNLLKRKKIVTEAIKNKLNSRNDDSLWDIPKLAKRIKNNDVSENHDKYLSQNISKRKSNL